MRQSQPTRRRFLRMASVAVAGTALAACQPKVVETLVEKEVTRVVEKEVEKVVKEAVEVEKEVTRVVEKQVAAPRGKIELKIATDWNVGVRKDAMHFWADEFMAQNPNVDVEVWHLGGGGTSVVDYGGVVQTMLVTGVGPDVMIEMFWKPQETLLCLDPYLEKTGFNIEDYWYSEYYQKTPDGRFYSLPFGAYLGGLMVNTDLFEDAGVPLPANEGKDWDFNDLRELAAKLRSKEKNVWGFERQTGPWNQGWTERLASEGAEWYDTETLKTTFDKDTRGYGGDPVAMFKDWWGLVWEDHLAPTEEELALLGPEAPIAGRFPTGHIAIAGFSYNQAGVVKETVGDRFNYRVLWHPKSPYSGKRGYHIEANCISVNIDALERGHAEEAVDLALYWLSEPVQEWQATYLPVIPAKLKWHSSTQLFAHAPGMEIFPEVAEEAASIGNDRNKWLNGSGAANNSLEWFRAIRGKLEDRALKGGEDAEASLMAAIEEGDKILATADGRVGY